ncbi:SDR family NAD(P)-dependent oxidoreductase [[Kitasatospora] papulosa]|uniref:SDR family NAD(P)-dependent oxidoreductase n=1 Tax=[Kitasatospora] papulosa TaxID=1464011 RepID=UPI0036962220
MTALVTGATGGMGLAIARRLTDEGARVMLCARDPERAAKEARTLRASWHAGDLTAPESARAALTAATRQFGRLDVVIAAVGFRGNTRDLSAPVEGECARVLDDNVITLTNTLTAALPVLTESKGSFITLSSLAGLTAYPRFPYYTAAKAATIGLIRAAAPQGRRRGGALARAVYLLHRHTHDRGLRGSTRQQERAAAAAVSRRRSCPVHDPVGRMGPGLDPYTRRSTPSVRLPGVRPPGHAATMMTAGGGGAGRDLTSRLVDVRDYHHPGLNRPAVTVAWRSP